MTATRKSKYIKREILVELPTYDKDYFIKLFKEALKKNLHILITQKNYHNGNYKQIFIASECEYYDNFVIFKNNDKKITILYSDLISQRYNIEVI